MRESRSYGSVRGALSNERPYRECFLRPVTVWVEFIGENGGGPGVRLRRRQPKGR